MKLNLLKNNWIFEYDSDETDTLHQDNLICMIEELEKQLKEQFSN